MQAIGRLGAQFRRNIDIITRSHLLAVYNVSHLPANRIQGASSSGVHTPVAMPSRASVPPSPMALPSDPVQRSYQVPILNDPFFDDNFLSELDEILKKATRKSVTAVTSPPTRKPVTVVASPPSYSLGIEGLDEFKNCSKQ